LTSVTIEAECLEDIDLDLVPPCELLIRGNEICGRPSEFRVFIQCETCGHSARRFWCRPCYRLVTSSTSPLRCRDCKTINPGFVVNVI
jgi:acyl-ACP thioesterase